LAGWAGTASVGLPTGDNFQHGWVRLAHLGRTVEAGDAHALDASTRIDAAMPVGWLAVVFRFSGGLFARFSLTLGRAICLSDG
jgi:hypothetical protein